MPAAGVATIGHTGSGVHDASNQRDRQALLLCGSICHCVTTGLD